MAELYLNQSRPVFGTNGGIEAGAKVFFYLTGTTTPTPIYADAGLVTELPNPVVANAAGVFPSIYLDTDNVTYRAVLTTSADVTLSEVDPYYPGDLNDAIETSVNAATTVTAGYVTDAEAARDIAEAAAALALQANAGWPFVGRNRNRFGLLYAVGPNDLFASQVEPLPGGRMLIAGGVGNKFQATISAQVPMQVGEEVLGFFAVRSGTPLGGKVIVGGGSTVNLVEDSTGKWSASVVLPAGFSFVRFEVTSDGTEPLDIDAGFAIAEAGATGAVPHAELIALQGMIQNGYQPGNGNIWPTEEKGLVNVAANGLSGSVRNFGSALAPGEDGFLVARAFDAAGQPAHIRNMSQTLFSVDGNGLMKGVPVFGIPGLLFGRYRPTGTFTMTWGAYLQIDNRSINGHVAGDVTVRDIQQYRERVPTYLPRPEAQKFAADTIFYEQMGGVSNVYLPAFLTSGTDYQQIQMQEYDLTSSAGGGVGNLIREWNIARRTGPMDFAARHRMAQGQSEFAMKSNLWIDGNGTSQHSGHYVHKYHTRRAPSEVKIDGVAVADLTELRRQECQQIVRKDFTVVQEWGDANVAVGNLDTVKTFLPEYVEIENKLTLLQDFSSETAHMIMIALDAKFDAFDGASAQPIVDRITMPNQGGAEYPPGVAVNPAYPNESRFLLHTTEGVVWDIEIVSGWDDPLRNSYWLYATNEVKLYADPLGIFDNSGLAGAPPSRLIPAGTVVSMKTRIRFYQESEVA